MQRWGPADSTSEVELGEKEILLEKIELAKLEELEKMKHLKNLKKENWKNLKNLKNFIGWQISKYDLKVNCKNFNNFLADKFPSITHKQHELKKFLQNTIITC